MVVTMGALLMIGPGMIGLFTSPYVAIALLCVGGFAHQALSGALITLSSDVFGRNEVATANGLTGMAAWMASTMFALVVGALADTIGFSPLFAVLAVFDLLGALVIWTVLKNKSADDDARRSKRLNRPRKASPDTVRSVYKAASQAAFSCLPVVRCA
jgi:ACS family hexuronate transporter-like MFS transporter